MNESSDRYLDELLVLRCRRGDEDAWRSLVGRYERRLLYFIRRLVGDERDAFDVLQQTWLSAFDGIRRLTETRALRTWLYRVAHNQSISHLRRRGVRIESVDPAVLQDVVDDDRDEEAWDTDAAERVHEALAGVSLAHREVLTLYFLEDASIEEIAAILEMPPGTVKSRLHYAKAAMKSELKRLEVR